MHTPAPRDNRAMSSKDAQCRLTLHSHPRTVRSNVHTPNTPCRRTAGTANLTQRVDVLVRCARVTVRVCASQSVSHGRCVSLLGLLRRIEEALVRIVTANICIVLNVLLPEQRDAPPTPAPPQQHDNASDYEAEQHEGCHAHGEKPPWTERQVQIERPYRTGRRRHGRRCRCSSKKSCKTPFGRIRQCRKNISSCS